MFRSSTMKLSALLIIAGCTDADNSLIADDRAAVAAYERYQAQIAPDADLRVDVAVIEPAHRIRSRDAAHLVNGLPASRYLVPYFASVTVRPGDGIATALHPQLEQWGQNGYPENEAVAAEQSSGVLGQQLQGTASQTLDVPLETTGGDPIEICRDGMCCGDGEVTLDDQVTQNITMTGGGGDIPPTGGDGGGSSMPGGGDGDPPSGGDGGGSSLPGGGGVIVTSGGDGGGSSMPGGSTVLAFRPLDGVQLFTSRALPGVAPIAASRLRVTLTSGDTSTAYDALVLHYPDAEPEIVDRVLLGINDQVAPAGLGELMQEADSPWTKNADGCQSYAFGWGQNVSWKVKKGFLFTFTTVFVQATAFAQMTCAVYDKPNNGGKGCRLASYDGTPAATGQGADACSKSYYVTQDTATGKDALKGDDGNNIGVDFSIGASAHLVNTDTAKVLVKLEGKAEGKKVGGNGQVNVKFERPGGSYGGVDVAIDGEVICPDYVKP